MYINPAYSFYQIADTPYLLPHGQAIADHKHGIQLNEAGVWIWNALQKTTSRDQLLADFYSHYGAEPKDYAQLKQDLDHFLNELFALKILLVEGQSQEKHPLKPPFSLQQAPSPEPEKLPSSGDFRMQIGPLLLRLVGDEDAIPSEFLPFQMAKNAAPDFTVELKTGVPDIRSNTSMTLLIRHAQLLVYEMPDSYLLEFPQAPQLSCAVLYQDGTYASVYHRPPYTEALKTDLFHAIRILFLYTAQLHGCYALHSASIYYRDQAWLFSGHSGMGKSTHTNLWQRLYQVKILNGDLNFLSLSDGKPVVYGIPWCGTSKIADTGTYSLGGIILLERGSKDECLPLSLDKQILLVAQRLISPTWTANLFQHNLDFISSLASHIAICILKCTKEPSAAATAKQWIDCID